MAFLAYAALLTIILLVARLFEKQNPVEVHQPASELIVDLKLAALQISMHRLLGPLITSCAMLIVNTVHGGWINLRSDRWHVLPSVIILVLAIDFWAYLSHRAQHKFSFLWAMHSLHHSAKAVTVVTGARHFWFENFIFTAGFPVLAIIFSVPAELALPTTLFYFLAGDGMAHLNLRVSLGRFALCIQNPQYHRIHHSVELQHQDKNFCKLLPIFDVIFGTAWKPGGNEFPKTGLAEEEATGFLDGITWPVRHILSRKVTAAIRVRAPFLVSCARAGLSGPRIARAGRPLVVDQPTGLAQQLKSYDSRCGRTAGPDRQARR